MTDRKDDLPPDMWCQSCDEYVTVAKHDDDGEGTWFVCLTCGDEAHDD